ncbi:MAG: cytochrome c [Campylobacterota bacterium]|nr:cytochrome c [Campylobacterota bacterium]
MKFWLLALLVISLHSAESFITKEEYARQLFHSPRGIGCHLCHGESGEGKLIAKYEDKKEAKSFSGSAIKDMDFDRFSEALNGRVRGMPRYFLTKSEVKALYYYLQFKNKRPDDDKKQD